MTCEPEAEPPDTPWPETEHPFTEPWQAQVFALTMHLHDQGLFTWAEWSDALSNRLHQPEAARDGSDYYHHWAAALENLLAAKAVASPELVEQTAEAWTRAAHATPHGQPIVLGNDPEFTA